MSEVASPRWDGNVLVGWLAIDGEPMRFEATRDTIHRFAAGFNDALTWEIERHAGEIFERLKPFFASKVEIG